MCAKLSREGGLEGVLGHLLRDLGGVCTILSPGRGLEGVWLVVS